MLPQGIPVGSKFRKLDYNAIAECVIALYEIHDSFGRPRDALFFRHVNHSVYKVIDLQDERLVIRSPISITNRPEIIFNLLISRDNLGKERDWNSLASFNFIDKSVKHIFTDNNLPIISGYKSGWVSTILSANDDFTKIVIAGGFDKESSENVILTDYLICEIDMIENHIKKLAVLPNTYA